jgi:hypothetical protein
MSRTIASLFRPADGQQQLADRELSRYATELESCIKELADTAAGLRWQDHHRVALEVCRVSRRVRFRFADIENCDFESRTDMLLLLNSALKEIRTDADASGLENAVKTLDAIRDNIQHRITCIEEDRDSEPFENS